jgi:ABC-type nitrate/sulfonate/bicarbonate transport system substrate-binding protein
MPSITVALDWTANANHIGFYVAEALGYFAEAGLDVTLHTPDADDYARTPAKRVELGEADFALCPFESVLSYNTKRESFPLRAVAAILHRDASAIATLETSGLKRPADLDGRTYASYAARYEDEIVRQMVRNDGGAGEITLSYPAKLGIWETLLEGEADATWIFVNWEGLQAERAGVRLNLFPMRDYGIPYGYSPVLAASAQQIEARETDYRAFVGALRRGYVYAAERPEHAAELLAPHVPEADRPLDLARSVALTAEHYDAERWGHMEADAVNRFLAWLRSHGLDQSDLYARDLITNELL